MLLTDKQRIYIYVAGEIGALSLLIWTTTTVGYGYFGHAGSAIGAIIAGLFAWSIMRK